MQALDSSRFNPSTLLPGWAGPTTNTHHSQQPSALSQHNQRLGRDTSQAAQAMLGQLAGQLFGQQNFKIEWDEVSLAAATTAGAAASVSSNGAQQTSSTAFLLREESQFKGRGTISTADGRQFEFEFELSFSREQTAAFSSQTSAATPTSEREPAQTRSNATPLSLQFGGLADELLQQLSPEPVGQAVKINDQPAQLLVKLLNLPGGERFLDWQGQRQGLDTQA
ncbi:hypothetical protein [Chitinibacter tainanensis]|uniref:hypothetical protein n=1 Tax=Chitinibacter tainanensis TaxID=230667 RepID=UPI00235526CD|nr:hypothetical protein [Chitinibacter tainanensis]